MPVLFALLINMASQNPACPLSLAHWGILKIQSETKWVFHRWKGACFPIHGILKRWILISEKTKLRERENAYLRALKNYDIT